MAQVTVYTGASSILMDDDPVKLMREAIVISDGNVRRAAHLLGFDRRRLYRLMKRYGLLAEAQAVRKKVREDRDMRKRFGLSYRRAWIRTVDNSVDTDK